MSWNSEWRLSTGSDRRAYTCLDPLQSEESRWFTPTRPSRMLGHLVRGAVVVAVIVPSCNTQAITVNYRIVDDYRFSWSERRMIQSIADTAIRDVRALLPTLPEDLVLDVRASDDVIPELGYTGSPVGRTVYWRVDPHRQEGVRAIADRYLRTFLFFACYQLLREQSLDHTSLMDFVVSRGLETVFGRDLGGTAEPWAEYPPEVQEWVIELQGVPDTAPRDHWMNRHPDGRRWIGSKAGVYLVDRAIAASGHSVMELMSASTEDVLQAAGSRMGPE